MCTQYYNKPLTSDNIYEKQNITYNKILSDE